jgi:cell division septal protein FtsQ
MSWSPYSLGHPPKRRGLLTRLFRRRRSNNFRRRPPGERKRWWGRFALVNAGVFGLVGLSLGLVFLYYHLLTSPYFCIKDIKNIEISGASRLSPDLIRTLADLGPETNLLALRPHRVERAITAHPWVAKAELTRRWPNRVEIRISEREPVALVQLGELYYADHQGNLFKPLSPGDPLDFPVITGLKQEQFAPGQGGPVIFSQVMEVMAALKEAAPPLNLANISEIHADQERGFTVYANGLKSGVHLGLTDFPAKLQKFAQIWPALVQKGFVHQASVINLDYPQRVLLSLKGTEDNQ